MRKFLSKRNIIIVIIVAVIAFGVYWQYGREAASTYDLITVERRSIAQEVNVTGRVKPAEEVNLAFERGGRVAKVDVKIGDLVKTGDALVELDMRDLSTDLNKTMAALRSAEAGRAQYEAILETQRAKLEELKIGARDQEISVTEARVFSARQILADYETDLVNVQEQATLGLNNEYNSVPNILNDAFAKADDAVTKQTDEFFSDDNTSPRMTFTTSNSQAQIDVERMRGEMNNTLAAFRVTVNNISADQASLDAALSQTMTKLNEINNFLLRLTDTLNTSTSLSQATLTIYKGYLNTARTNINSALSSVSTKQQTISSKKASNKDSIDAATAKVSQAKNSLSLAVEELALKRAGPTAEQLKAKEAEVRQAEANLRMQDASIQQAAAAIENINVQISKAVIVSPINGVVTEQKTEVGEIIAANAVIVSVISGGFSAQGGPQPKADEPRVQASGWEIEADIPEADIAKIKIGNVAKATLDAYGDEVVFEVAVTSTDPAEKLIEGVATYRTILQFINDDIRIKSGMTANVVIAGEKRANVLTLPQRVIAVKAGKKTVQILDGEKIREVEIKTGLRGADGNIEIIEGLMEGLEVLKEGDKVVVYRNGK